MKYKNIVEGIFVKRHNRFTATVMVSGVPELCHVKNTGRLSELLTEGRCVFLEKHDKPQRKTAYSLVSVMKADRCINIDSQAPNKVFYEWAEKGGFLEGITLLKPESRYKNSRFDCYIETPEKKIFVEVKGVTLERDGTALFPDAPTERGVKHLRELCECKHEGYDAYVVFVVQMKGVHTFSPNRKTHEAFAKALCECRETGVEIVCVDCNVTPDTIEISQGISIKL